MYVRALLQPRRLVNCTYREQTTRGSADSQINSSSQFVTRFYFHFFFSLSLLIIFFHFFLFCGSIFVCRYLRWPSTGHRAPFHFCFFFLSIFHFGLFVCIFKWKKTLIKLKLFVTGLHLDMKWAHVCVSIADLKMGDWKR